MDESVGDRPCGFLGEYRHDPSQDFIAQGPDPLEPFFHPRSIALIGAKDEAGTVGRTLMGNLLEGGFSGPVYPVNPKRKEVLGRTAYPSVLELPSSVDLAVIATPATTIPGIIEQCGAAGIPAAIVISAGFKEQGAQGLALEQELLDKARKGNVRIVGPNCLGIMNPLHGLNATFARGMAYPGQIAFISQSGALCTAVLDWSLQQRVGFSAFVSIGSMADIGWGELIRYLGSQTTTRSILLYMESIGDSRAFLSAAREVAIEKPIIVIKAGRTAAAAAAAASHTGALAGSDEVFQAALDRVGVLQVDTIGELFHMASVLARQPLPHGPRLAILTNAGGPAVLATDAAVHYGVEVSPLTEKTNGSLNSFLPPTWSHGNPVDILGDAHADRYEKAVELLMEDGEIDGVLVILSPQDMTDPTGSAEALRRFGKNKKKTLLASWMGGDAVKQGIELLTKADIPVFPYPDEAAWTFAAMWHYSHTLKSIYATPPLRNVSVEESKRNEVARLLQEAFGEGRLLLSEFEAKEVLSLYGIPCVKTYRAEGVEEAVTLAHQMGYPVVLKLFSETITHKSDVGGVKLNLQSDEEVRLAFTSIRRSVVEKVGEAHFQGVTVQRFVQKGEGYELILGSSYDSQFGSVLLFGTGGELVEVYRDKALALPPLNALLARRLMERTKIFKALQGVRGRKAVDIELLEQLLIRFSSLIVEHREIKECDINPLLANRDGVVALDARIVLHEKGAQLPKPAIRPYPYSYCFQATLKDGTPVTLRPICPEDEPKMVIFHQELSTQSVRQRFFAFLTLSERIAHERLLRICCNDYGREIAIVAERGGLLLGLVRLTRLVEPGSAELKMIIVDQHHGKGLGTLLLSHGLEIARKEGMERIYAHVLKENVGMISLCIRHGFVESPLGESPTKGVLAGEGILRLVQDVSRRSASGE